MASPVPSLLFCLLLLVSPHLGCSYYTSYTQGGKHIVVRSKKNPQQPTPACSIHSGSNSDGLPVVHRLSPCSTLGAARDKEMPSAADVLRRDALRLRSLFRKDSGASAVSSGARITIPNRGDPVGALPGASEYHVVAGFGTPAQKFTVGFDTATVGATQLLCKPCATFPEPCDNSFDPSASSSLAHVPCGSPDCPFHGCSGPSCTLSVSVNTKFLGNVTFVTDTLTLSPLFGTVENFRFACMEAGLGTRDSTSGILDLSRNSHSLASRAPSSPDTVAFSYCLPSPAKNAGFLSIGAARPERSGRNVSYTPLRGNADNGNLYLVKLVGLSLGGHDIAIPPAAMAGDSMLDLHTTFTYLRPEAYAALRGEFREAMSQYRAAPPLGELDTCYDFKGEAIVFVPVITLRFDGGASVELSFEQTVYFPNRDNHLSVGCLAFVAANRAEVAVIGSMAQTSTEVVYDVHGGKVGFVPSRC
ncbi:hypothetical protein ACP70R_047258 [Stipagrostis hirtigluma subsp. patula]